MSEELWHPQVTYAGRVRRRLLREITSVMGEALAGLAGEGAALEERSLRLFIDRFCNLYKELPEPTRLALAAGAAAVALDDAGSQGGPKGDGTIGAARNFMQRPKRQPSSRQHPVDLGDTEGQDLAPACRAALEPRDAVPKFGQCRAVRGHGHARALVSQVGYVLFLFSIR